MKGSAGSSPLARGTLEDRGHYIGVMRFIPAGAGNTRTARTPPHCRPVHPRWRGEHWQEYPGTPDEAGSSPLARGTPWHSVQGCRSRRFIPAGAGNTPPCASASSASAVHPRWRGEHMVLARPGRLIIGSSPLARGTLFGCLGQVAVRRFIPAGAGNTWLRSSCLPQCTVHPRWRGEHWRLAESFFVHRGSSPLARGTQVGPFSIFNTPRFIPAGAGNTQPCSRARPG